MQKLKRHGNGGSCLKKHEKLKIKIFAERVMENHIYSSIDFYISISVIKHTIELFFCQMDRVTFWLDSREVTRIITYSVIFNILFIERV